MPGHVEYFIRRSIAEHTEIVRRLSTDRIESFGSTGTWEPVEPPTDVEESALTPISAETAALELYRLRESGEVPKVEGVVIPLLPRNTEPAPRPGSGPVDIYQAQAIADEWMGRGNNPHNPIRGGVYEFDLGFVVYPLAPIVRDDSASGSKPRPRSSRVGSGVGVIDRHTGELSLWPNLPHGKVAEMYRNSRSQE
ncbi:hypothetical protein [Nocardia cyriacigeorgica]|uniref:hypothetical protein n=1 Tax=Nocardia cyriacigeorgica TaxID=135487 RepID=UPI0024561AE4|nr:hypothetical protein [Nocardia cyriacigeorgica]